MIFIIVSLIVILFVLSIWFRKQITGLTGTVKDYAIGNWYRTYPVFRKALIFGGVGWIVLMIGLGTYANSLLSALIIIVLFPFWFVSMLIPRRVIPASAKWKIPIFGIIRVFGGIVLIIASISLAVGLWSPDTKGALNERSDDSKVWTANFFKKGSAHSERNAGVRGRAKSATEVYDDFNKPIAGIIPAGRIIMVLSLQGKPATKDREALLPVMLPNKHGNFVDGERVWMPALKIEFVSNEEQENSVSVSKNIPNESWRMCWQENPVPECWNVELKMIGSQIFIKGKASTWFRFEGERTTENTHYVGGWKDYQSNGPFCLDFDPTFTTAEGWWKYPNGPEVKTWLRKN